MIFFFKQPEGIYLIRSWPCLESWEFELELCFFCFFFFFTFSLNELWLLPWVEVGPGFDHLAHMRLRKFCFWSYWKEFPILLPGFIPQVLVLASWAGLWKGEGVRRMWSLFGERLPKPPLWRFCPFSAYVGTLRWHG